MIKYILIIFFVFIGIKAIAAPALQDLDYILQSPPKTEDAKALYDYLNTIYSRWNTMQVSTQEPNGNIGASYGNLIIYYDGSDYWLAIQTKAPSGTVWKGVKLGSV